MKHHYDITIRNTVWSGRMKPPAYITTEGGSNSQFRARAMYLATGTASHAANNLPPRLTETPRDEH
jgi:hypothetical protein